VLYDGPGADYYTRRDPERTRRNAINQLQRLGYQVTLTPTAAQHKGAATREIFESEALFTGLGRDRGFARISHDPRGFLLDHLAGVREHLLQRGRVLGQLLVQVIIHHTSA
jgi:hypothetical protein